MRTRVLPVNVRTSIAHHRKRPSFKAATSAVGRYVSMALAFLLVAFGFVGAASAQDLLWSKRFGAPIVSSAVVIDRADDTGEEGRESVIVGDANGLVRAFDTTTGEVLWRKDLGARLQSSPVFHEAWGIVVFALRSGRVHALRVADGKTLWKRDLKEKVVASPTITIDGRVIVGTSAGGLYALGGDDGDIAWQRRLSGPVIDPAVATRDLKLIVAVQSTENSLIFLDATTGNDEDRSSISFGVLPSGSPATDDHDRVIYAHSGGEFVVSHHRSRSQAAIEGRPAGVSVSPDGNSAWVASSLLTGDHRLWRFEVGSVAGPEARISIDGVGGVGAPPIIGENGTAYVVSQAGEVRAITLDGAEKLLFRISDAKFVAQPVMSRGGTLFVGDSSGTFHAINTDEAGSWPTVGQNAQRTGHKTGKYYLPGKVIEPEGDLEPLVSFKVKSLGQASNDVAEAMTPEGQSTVVVASQAGRFTIEKKDADGKVHRAKAVRVLNVPIQRFFVSDQVPIPRNANVDLTPRGPIFHKLNADGSYKDTEDRPLLWRKEKETLHALLPGVWRIEWKSKHITPFFVDISIEWPNDPARVQRHIEGSLPVQVTDEAAGYTKAFLWWAEGVDAQKAPLQPLANGEFKRDEKGRSVLVLGDSEQAGGGNKLAFLLVETVPWDDPSVFQGEHPATIGSAINYNRWHRESGRAPLVIKKKARVNVDATSGYYKRETRTGPIIPVNEDDSSDPDDDLVLAFYQRGKAVLQVDAGNETMSAFPGWSDEKRFYGDYQRQKPTLASSAVYWPVASAHYSAEWPEVREDCDTALSPSALAQCSERLVIAAQSSNPFRLDSSVYGDEPAVYRQNKPNEPGYNPNEEHAFIEDGVLWVLRSDLNGTATSKPYVLVSYRDPGDGQVRMKVVHVVPETERQSFTYNAIAGQTIVPPSPLGLGHLEIDQIAPNNLVLQDRTGALWAYRAHDTGDPLAVTTRYCYRPRGDFDLRDATSAGTVCRNPAHLPWLAVHAARKRITELGAGEDSEKKAADPIDVKYVVRWPTNPPVLKLGGTLTTSRDGLPGVYGSQSVEIVYQQSNAQGQGPSVRLLDPLKGRTTKLDKFPDDLRAPRRSEVLSGKRYFSELPPHLRHQFYHDENGKKLAFRGRFISKDGKLSGRPTGDAPSVLLNVLTQQDAERIKKTLAGYPVFDKAVDSLRKEASAPLVLTSPQEAAETYAITTAENGTTGYVTIALNNVQIPGQRSGPVSVEVFRVGAPFESGRVIVIEHSNPFAEEIYVRHSGDFGGRPELYEFDWRIASTGENGKLPNQPPNDWGALPSGSDSDPDHNARLIKGYSQLSNNYVAVRIGQRAGAGQEITWLSEFTKPQLVEGWLKRVSKGIGPFDAVISNFRKSPPGTTVSMIEQAGIAYRGPVPLDQKKAKDRLGLIQIYETVFRRGKALSIDGAPARKVPSLNRQLQHFAGVLSDLYFLLGNEAQADAVDPTVLVPSQSRSAEGFDIGDVHAFKGVVPSLLQEELALLRGVSGAGVTDVHEGPAYNRLRWNITGDNQKQPFYVLHYGIAERNAGTLDEESPETRAEQRDIVDIAKKRFPQGHGDAYGHYLSALKVYYGLIRDDEFDWTAGSSATTIGGEAVDVDYVDERRFAQAAVGRARTGLAVTGLTHRRDFSHGTANRLSQKTAGGDGANVSIPLAWGMSDWASRSGQGAYLDWVVGNALLPAKSDEEEHPLFSIDRSTVSELVELADIGVDIQLRLDQASAGLNPLGIPPSVVPFDIDVNAQLTQQTTAFDIFYERVLGSFSTARHTLLEASGFAQRIQNDGDDANRLRRDYEDREFALNGRLIELFGTPFPSDIGAGKTYSTGYNGPDIYLFYKHRCSDLFERAKAPTLSWSVTIPQVTNESLHGETAAQVARFELTNEHFKCVDDLSDERRASPGAIQTRQRELVLAGNELEQRVREYNSHIVSIREEQQLVELAVNSRTKEGEIGKLRRYRIEKLNDLYYNSAIASKTATRFARASRDFGDSLIEAIPKVLGLSNDTTSGIRSGLLAAQFAEVQLSEAAADAADIVALDQQLEKELVHIDTDNALVEIRSGVITLERLNRLRALVRQESSLRNALYTRYEAVRQAADNYRSTLAEAHRVLVQRHRLRSLTAADVRQLRYRDMAYRLLRSKASADYSAQFDKVLKEAFLLVRIFDYSTNYAESDAGAPALRFYQKLLRTRTLGGLRRDGVPRDGNDDSLSSVLAEMKREYEEFRQQLGIPVSEPETLSLRTGLFRIPSGTTDDSEEYLLGNGEVWRTTLQSYLVPSLENVTELRGCCRGVPNGSALVIPFSTPLADSGNQFNHFGFLIGGGDAGFNSSQIDCKLATVRVVFDGYDQKNLARTPRVYLIPAGQDVFRSPPLRGAVGSSLEVRRWSLGPGRLPETTPGQLAPNVSAAGRLASVYRERRFGPFDAVLGFEQIDEPEQAARATKQYYGRSIYNTRWLLVIPAKLLNAELSEVETWEHFLGRPGSGGGRQGYRHTVYIHGARRRLTGHGPPRGTTRGIRYAFADAVVARRCRDLCSRHDGIRRVGPRAVAWIPVRTRAG